MAITNAFNVSNEGAVEAYPVLTFYHPSLTEADEGKPVKITGNDTVGLCADGDPIVGIITKIEKDICSVKMGGQAVIGYSGPAPAVGWTALVGDGAGKVKIGAGTGPNVLKLITAVDTAATTVTFLF